MGLIFDIKEFAVHDGPGIRITVFCKGCPLQCAWCHNPEGISPFPETMNSPIGSRIVGCEISSDELVAKIMSQADILRDSGGGVTFSGGEPLMQADFIGEVLDKLNGIHTLLDTSGYSRPEVFKKLASRFGLIHYDLKLISPEMHEKYCGVDNGPILKNFELLQQMSVPFIIRVPMVPGVTDTTENLADIAELASGAKNLLHVELLAYNQAAGGKYLPLGRKFAPAWDENAPVNYHQDVFSEYGIKVKIS